MPQRSRPYTLISGLVIPTWAWLAAALALLAFAVWQRYLQLTAPLNFFDEGVLMIDSELVSRGQLVFRDFYSIYPPGIYYLLSGVWVFTGPSPMAMRVLGLGLMLGIAMLGGRHAGALAGQRFSWLTAALIAMWLFPLGNTPFAWIAALLLLLVFVELLAQAEARSVPGVRAPFTRWALGAGLSLALASAFRHDLFVYFFVGAVLATVVGSWLSSLSGRAPLLSYRSMLLPLGVAGAAAGAIWSVILALGSVRNVWRDLIYNVAVYIMPARTLPFPDLLRLQPAPLVPIELPALLTTPLHGGVILCVFGTIAAGWLLYKSRSESSPPVLRSTLLFILMLATLPQMSGRTDLAHVLMSVPVAMLAIGACVERRIASRSPFAHLSALAAIVLLVLPLIRSSAFAPSGKPHERARFIGLPRERGVPQPDVEIAQARRQVADVVFRHTRSGEPIYVGTDQHVRAHTVELDLYFLLDRTGGTRFMQFDPNLVTRRDVQEEMIADLKQRRVRLVVLSSRILIKHQENILPGSGLLDAYLATHFKEIARTGPYRVLLTKQENSSPR